AGHVKAQNTFPPTGNAGIGTISPQTNLHIMGATTDVSAMLENTTDGITSLSFKSNSKKWMWSKRPSGESDAFTLLYNDGTNWIVPDYLHVQTNGNLGIGTGTPHERLEVGGNIQLAGNNPYIQVKDRLTLQVTSSAANNWTRSLAGQNIKWDETSSQWKVDNGPYNDFSMVRFENGGNIGFYCNPGTGSSGSYNMSDVSLKPSLRMLVRADGQVGIGTDAINDGTYKLYVQTGIRTRKVKVDMDTWSDYVFDKSYVLRPLSEVKNFIQQYQRLPEVPSAAEVAKEGIDLGQNQAVLLKKIEELTLYVIEQQKQVDELRQQVQGIQKTIKNIAK
ncbi:MAG TPA: hypothetical protein VLD19_10520, partial [Chitinophagaceae bacterium]|nr:hypothetical protein [Chitinophagaceae bacterium]